MKKKLMIGAGLVLGFAPFVALAALGTETGGGVGCVKGAPVADIQTFLCKIGDILNIVIPILIVLGVLYFVWGVITYVIGSDEEAKKAGRDRIIFGIIGLAVIIGVWGLVKFLTNTFNTGGTRNIDFPTTPY